MYTYMCSIAREETGVTHGCVAREKVESDRFSKIYRDHTFNIIYLLFILFLFN